VTKIEEKITPRRTRGILPVHIYGIPCDMDSIRTLARDYRLFVVEDCGGVSRCALSRRPGGGRSGTRAAFRFLRQQALTTGEGGIILTDDDKLATALRHCRAYDFDDTRHFWHKRLAWNLRMSSLEAALGRAQLERLDELIAARQRN
jgi:perosamine synthetase